jgi:hypothetical protein
MDFETVASGASRPSGVSKRYAAVVIALLVCLSIDGYLAWEVRKQVSLGATDFVAFYTAGQLVSQGNGARLFVGPPPHVTVAYPNSDPAPFTHAPYEALLFVPFAHLNYAAAAWLWCVVNILVANLCIYLLLPDLPGVAARPELAVLAVGLFMPVLITEFNGQDSLLTLLMLSLCFKGLMRDRVALAGAALACACFKPPLAIAMFVLIVATCRGRWKFIGGFAATGCGLLLLSIAAVGWNGVAGYPAFLRRYAAGADQYHVSDMPNIRGLTVGLLQGHASGFGITLVVAALSGLVLVVAVWAGGGSGGRFEPLKFALFVTATVLVGFHEYAYDLVLLVVPILFLWNWSSTRGSDDPHGKWIRLVPVILVLGSILTSFKPPIYTCAVVLLFVLLCREVIRARAAAVAGKEAVQSAV